MVDVSFLNYPGYTIMMTQVVECNYVSHVIAQARGCDAIAGTVVERVC